MGPMRRSRSDNPDLLTRRPLSERTLAQGSGAAVVNQVEQVRELAKLMDRGLVSREEFERQRSKVFGL
ncbi:MAG: SHOCT domain-containing protein [Nocardioidaceae bacterium]